MLQMLSYQWQFSIVNWISDKRDRWIDEWRKNTSDKQKYNENRFEFDSYSHENRDEKKH